MRLNPFHRSSTPRVKQDDSPIIPSNDNTNTNTAFAGQTPDEIIVSKANAILLHHSTVMKQKLIQDAKTDAAILNYMKKLIESNCYKEGMTHMEMMERDIKRYKQLTKWCEQWTWVIFVL